MDYIRPHLQSVTRSFPAPILKFGLSQLGPDCYKTLVLDIDLSSTECLKLGFSKALGLGIVAGSSIVKVPQILKLLDSQSASGVSFLSYLLETASFIVTIAYSARNGFPFSTYGETALIAAQNVAICLLVLRFQGKTAAAGAFVGGLLTVGWALQNDKLIDANTLSYAQAGAGLLGVLSKVPQIYTIWQEGGTGQLSAFAVFNYLIGSLSRIFTTIQEVDDKLLLYGFIAGFTLNLILAGQMVYYWQSAPPSKKKTRGGRQPAKITSGTTTATPARAKGPSTRRKA